MTDVTGRTDRDTRQTCKRGQEQDLGQDKARLGLDLEGISSREIPDRTGTGARAGTFNRLYDFRYKRLRKERKIHQGGNRGFI